jgi:signal transduction histidine kinase
MVWGAYMTIPAILIYFATRRQGLPFKPIFLLFGLFIFACGTTHLMGYITTITPVYRLDALVKFITAIASWATVIALWFIAPKALSMRMPEDLEREIEQRKKAEESLRELNLMLEERTQQLQHANQELESFCYSVSHDIRAPLRGIVGNSKMVLEDAADRLDDESRHNLQRMGIAANKLAALVDGLLDFSRLGRDSVAKQAVDITALAEEIAEQTAGECGEVIVAPGLKAEGNPQLIKQVLFNLIENACKYVKPGEKPHVEVGAVEQDGEAVYFVRDHGLGFDMAYAAKVFAPFERLHRDEEYPGTGIGLATVKRIVEKHGGQIWVESVPGQGSTFFFTLASQLPAPLASTVDEDRELTPNT